jgi:hypothetical protein
MAVPVFYVGFTLLFLFFLYMKFSDMFPGQKAEENNEAQEGFEDGEVAQEAEQATDEEEEQQSEADTNEQEDSDQESEDESAESEEPNVCDNCGNAMFEKDGYTFLTCSECKKKVCFNCGTWFENSQIALCNKCMGKEQPKAEAKAEEQANYEDMPIDETEFDRVL